MARFSAPVQTGRGAHPASCTMGTEPFPGKKWPGRDADPSPTSSAVVMKVRAIPLLPLWVVRPVQNLGACTRGALYLLPVPGLFTIPDPSVQWSSKVWAAQRAFHP